MLYIRCGQPISVNLAQNFNNHTGKTGKTWNIFLLINMIVGSVCLFLALIFLVWQLVLYKKSEKNQGLADNLDSNSSYGQSLKKQYIIFFIACVLMILYAVFCLIYFLTNNINSLVLRDISKYTESLSDAERILTNYANNSQQSILQTGANMINNNGTYSQKPIVIDGSQIPTYFTMQMNIKEKFFTPYLASLEAQNFIQKNLEFFNTTLNTTNLSSAIENSNICTAAKILINQSNDIIDQESQINNNISTNVGLELPINTLKNLINQKIDDMYTQINTYNNQISEFTQDNLLLNLYKSILTFKALLHALIFQNLNNSDDHLLNLDGINKLYDYCGQGDIYNNSQQIVQNYIIYAANSNNIFFNNFNSTEFLNFFYEQNITFSLLQNLSTIPNISVNEVLIENQYLLGHQINAGKMSILIKPQAFYQGQKNNNAISLNTGILITNTNSNNQLVPILYINNMDYKVYIFQPQKNSLVDNITNIQAVQLNLYFNLMKIIYSTNTSLSLLPQIQNNNKQSKVFIDTTFSLNESLNYTQPNGQEEFASYINYLTKNSSEDLPYTLNIPYENSAEYSYNGTLSFNVNNNIIITVDQNTISINNSEQIIQITFNNYNNLNAQNRTINFSISNSGDKNSQLNIICTKSGNADILKALNMQTQFNINT